MKPTSDEIVARFKTWYEHEMPRLFNYVSYQVRDRETAEELTAVICERALTRLHQYDPDRGALNAWMFSIARNVIRNHHRKRRCNPETLALDAFSDVQARGDSLEAIYEKSEAFRQAVCHLSYLPELEQEIVALRYGAGLSNREVAHIIGLTPNHVGVLLHRALKKLRQAMLIVEEP